MQNYLDSKNILLSHSQLVKTRTGNMGRVNTRILVITGSNECASQYMTYMNVFFTAQKRNVVIDVCALDKNLSLLQQGCDITGGQYLKVPQLDGLLQYLLVLILNCLSKPWNLIELLFSLTSVGISAGSSNKTETSAAAGGQGGLQGSLLLPPRTHRHWLRVLRLFVE